MKTTIITLISLASAFVLSNCSGSFAVGPPAGGADQGAASGAAGGSAVAGAQQR